MLSTSSVSSFNVLFAWFLYTYIHTYMHACACAYTFLFLIDLRKICFFYSQHLKKKKKKSDKLSANTHLPEILKDLTNSTPYNVIFYLIHLIFTRTGVHPAPPHEDLHCQPAAASFSTGWALHRGSESAASWAGPKSSGAVLTGPADTPPATCWETFAYETLSMPTQTIKKHRETLVQQETRKCLCHCSNLKNPLLHEAVLASALET